MDIIFNLLCLAACVALLVMAVALVCFFKVFYYPDRKPLGENEYAIPPGRIYEPFRERMVEWTKQMRSTPHEIVSIRSYDGLTLYGKYYEQKKGAPVELLFHGYKGSAERDLCGGLARCFSVGHNVIVISQRCGDNSEGNVITFGIREHRDCLGWIDYAVDRFGDDVKIILSGVSMGAATVVMAGGCELPDNVKMILADCGYTSPKEIIKKVIREMHLPTGLLYPFVRIGGVLYGAFDIEEYSPIEAVKNCNIPVIFFHGDTDNFVPCDMSRELYDACAAEKKLVIIEGAGHGLCYPQNKEKYVTELSDFCARYSL